MSEPYAETYEVLYMLPNEEGYWRKHKMEVTIRGHAKHPADAKNWHGRAEKFVLRQYPSCKIEKVTYI